MSSMFRSSEKTCKKWSLKCLVFLWTNVDLQFLEMFGWDTSCNISNVPHDCPLFSEHEHVRGDTIDWSTEWRRKKKKRKRDQCRNQISMSCSSFQKAKLLAASSSSQQLHSTESSPAEPATAKYFKSSRLTKNDDKFWHLLRISVFGVTWQILNWRRWLMYDWNEKKKKKWNSQLFLSKDVLLSPFCFKDSVLEFVRVARFSISTYAMMELLVLPLSSTFTRKISIVFYRICSTRLVYLKYAWFKSFCNSNFRSTACSLHNTVISTRWGQIVWICGAPEV